jgi:hypothetical protein
MFIKEYIRANAWTHYQQMNIHFTILLPAMNFLLFSENAAATYTTWHHHQHSTPQTNTRHHHHKRHTNATQHHHLTPLIPPL